MALLLGRFLASQLMLAMTLLLSPLAAAQTYVEQTPAYFYDDPLASGAIAHSITDEGVVTLQLPWAFPFYGNEQNFISISDNGGIRFGLELATSSTNACLPSALAADNPDVAVFWDSLEPQANSSLHTEELDLPARYVITWVGFGHAMNAAGTTATFQAVLFPSGTIELRYAATAFNDLTVDLGASATVGIQDAVGSQHHSGNVVESHCGTATVLPSTALRYCDPSDADGDGFSMCSGDCDDNNIHRAPNLPDTCDAIDQDCDGDLAENYTDSDADGMPDCADFDDDGDAFPDIVDCAPLDNTIYPNAPESCDNIDSNCNLSLVDTFLNTDGDAEPDCIDLDDDGDGEPDGSDCDPLEPTTYPGAEEFCDGVDSDCDGDLVDGFPDFDQDEIADCIDDDIDGDGDPGATDCDDYDPLVFSGAVEACDLIDTDCDGSLDDEFPNADGDILPDCVDEDDDGDGDPDLLDCAPFDPSVHAGAAEACDALDSDCDGSLVDAFPNSDGDLLPDCVDDDDDGDGATDLVDCAPLDPAIYPGATELCDNIDTDCDGSLADDFPNLDGDSLPDCIDEDADDDGFLNFADCNDLDPATFPGAPELCDEDDSDCDGSLVDENEDTDSDGSPDCVDLDDDGDGISDGDELLLGSDPSNTDSDFDGLSDDLELGSLSAPVDSDGDGLPNLIDPDDDGDGIPTATEGAFDHDNDQIPNYLDDDSDNDGLTDAIEGPGDPDGDGTPSYLDEDSDGNGLLDWDDGTGDLDGDHTPDFLDVDDNDGPIGDLDGDTLLNAQEDALGSNPLDPDSDGDSLPDLLELGSIAVPVDTDLDGAIDVIDPDDDGDEIATLTELNTDADGDGLPDLDPDSDGVPNHHDEDSDGDSIDDADEGDGDFDGDGIPNWLDTDSDDDGLLDQAEGTTDSDGDGEPNAYDLDSDDDGLSDALEGEEDLDEDGLPNYVDVDSDGDGASDISEGTSDIDGDGTPNWLDPDDQDGPSVDPDQDGLSNAEEALLGTSGYDSDSDDDGLPDGEEVVEECDPLDPDTDDDGLSDGYELDYSNTDPLDSDSDDDGLTDGFEVQVSGTDPHLPDTDEDGLDDQTEVDEGTNPLDADSDDDGLLDGPDGLEDHDGDGLIAALDADETDGPLADPDGDGLSNEDEADLGTDPRNEDTDEDQLTDYDEVYEHGTDPLSADTDGDGYPDFTEINRGTNPIDPLDPDAPVCSCSSSMAQAGGAPLGLTLLFLLAGLRRRRRCSP